MKKTCKECGGEYKRLDLHEYRFVCLTQANMKRMWDEGRLYTVAANTAKAMKKYPLLSLLFDPEVAATGYHPGFSGRCVKVTDQGWIRRFRLYNFLRERCVTLPRMERELRDQLGRYVDDFYAMDTLATV